MSFAKQARELVAERKVGVLSTVSLRHPGWPYPAMMPYALDAVGRPVVLISRLAAHTQDLLADARASLQVTGEVVDANPAQTKRAAIMGPVVAVPEDEVEAVRDVYVERFPESAMWSGFGDFAFYRLEPMDIHFVGGFAAAAWITPAEYLGKV